MSKTDDTAPARIRILIADDHALIRRGITDAVRTQSDMAVVAEARGGEEAVALYRRHLPDVALIDIRMPGMDGLQVTHAIRREHPAARIIMLTTYEGSEDIHRAFAAGAQSYLMKSMELHEVLDVIRGVSRGEHRVPAAVARSIEERSSETSLTRREVEVLELVSKGLTNREIGGVLDVTEGTVKLHVKSILAKLSASDRTEAVTVAHSRGIIRLD